MIKKYIALFVLALSVSAASWAQDYSALGFKGEVSSASVGRFEYEFNSNGKATDIFVQCADDPLQISNVTRTSNGFTGVTSRGHQVTLTLKNGRIATAVLKNNNDVWNMTYTYNAQGFVSKITDSRVWYTETYDYNEGAGKVVTNNAKQLMKKYKDALEKGNKTLAEKYLAEYNKAAKSAHTNVRQSTVTTKKKRNTSNYTATFVYNRFDKFGNWTERTRTYNGYNYNESQSITYQPNFLSKYEWENTVLPSGNLVTIENFAKNSNTTMSYKNKAKDEWNRLALEEAKRSKGNNEKLLNLAKNSLTTAQNRETILDMVRQDIYSKQVEGVNDYAALRKVANMSDEIGYIFKDDTRNQILERSEVLRKDSLKKLLQEADAALEAKNYSRARDLLGKSLTLDPGNSKAEQLYAKADYMVCLDKEADGTITEADYESFLTSNPNSDKVSEIQNKRALLASSNFNKYTLTSEMNRVKSLPMDYETQKIVDRRAKHQYFINNRGSFVHGGLAINGAGGKGAAEIGGGLGLKFGWMCSFLNLYVGAEVQHIGYITGTEGSSSNSKSKDYPRMNATRLNIPAALRLNLSKDYDFDFFLSLGAQYNKVLTGGYHAYPNNNASETEWMKDKKILNDGTISPRFGLGISAEHIEFEVFGIIEPSEGIYDKKYLESSGTHANYLTDEDVYDEQINGKFRIGATLRVMF